MTSATRGRQMLGVEPDGVLAFEREANLSALFSEVDAVIASLVTGALSGRLIASVSVSRSDPDPILAVGPDAGRMIEKEFSPTTQQARGAWWLPDNAPLVPGLLNLPSRMLGPSKFPHSIAETENGRFALRNAHALFLWAALQGLFETLLAPIELRARVSGKSREKSRSAWEATHVAYTALGLSAEVFAPVRYGSGWARLPMDRQRQAKREVVDRLAGSVSDLTVQRWRVMRVGELVARYYTKSKREPASHRQVLTKQLAPALSAYFGGDWLAFLDYLGEQPGPSEQITTVLPKARLYVEGSEKVREVASAKGVPVEEVQRMLASFYGEATVQSPVERRVDVLRRYWTLFDEIHARQATGMPSLWGLVDEGLGFTLGADGVSNPGLYRSILPPELLAEIEELWGAECLERWPDRVVSTTHPHKLLADALGPALSFWHGCGLTAWFICEGPYSRTDLQDMETYYQRDLDALSEAGCPVDRTLFAEMVKAEKRLGPPEFIESQASEQEIAPGIVIRTSMRSGQKRAGFEILRDIVTRHRRAWAVTYLDGYLRSRWEPQLRSVAWEYSRWLAVKGKGPTLRQFAKFAVPTANAWFGGNLANLFGALGENPPTTPQRIKLMPSDRVAFAALVLNAVEAESLIRPHVWRDPEGYDRQAVVQRMADNAPRFVQLQEAMGRPPDAKEMRADWWQWPGGIEAIWPRYAAIVEDARITALDARPQRRVGDHLPAPPAAAAVGARPVVPQRFEPSDGAPDPTPPSRVPSAGQSPRRSFWDRLRGRP